MVNYLEAIIIGLIQGITEWLPISSSGHLVLIESIFKVKEPIIYVAVVHLASLIALFIIFRRDIINIIKSWIKLDFKSESSKLGIYVIIGILPAALVGYLFFDFFKKMFTNLLFVGFTFVINGIILMLSETRLGKKDLNFFSAFLIGVAQIFSIFPGISRSGITISVGMLQRIDKIRAATFSFLMAIPLIIGASIYSLKELEFTGNVNLLILSGLSSFIFSYLTLRFLLKLIKNKRFHYFGWYSLVLGLIVMFLNF